jgi:hypothetical protein
LRVKATECDIEQRQTINRFKMNYDEQKIKLNLSINSNKADVGFINKATIDRNTTKYKSNSHNVKIEKSKAAGDIKRISIG